MIYCVSPPNKDLSEPILSTMLTFTLILDTNKKWSNTAERIQIRTGKTSLISFFVTRPNIMMEIEAETGTVPCRGLKCRRRLRDLNDPSGPE